jgi:membrane protein implicated in regulation of membrane protease activity
MDAWLVWLIIAGGLAVGEVLTAGFILGPLALAALLGAAAAALGGGLAVQVVAFVAGSLASLLVLRPIARRHMRTPVVQRTGTAALVGQSAVVIDRVDVDGGRVKLAGEVWSACSYGEGDVYEPGARVTVVEISGATARVSA